MRAFQLIEYKLNKYTIQNMIDDIIFTQYFQ